jgi:oligo-1,6-glucosidase/alpha-glucosidase
MSFLFEFTSKALSFKPKKIAGVIYKIEQILPSSYTPTYVYGNHDRDRYISLLDNNIQKAKILATLQLTLRGVPYIYYGEEIGMSNVKFMLKTSKDPIGRKLSKFPFPLISKVLGFSLTRDRCRTPMQWNAELNAGFTSDPETKTWLRISNNYKHINVFNEEKNPNSLLNCYKQLLKVRGENITLQEGLFEIIDLGKLNNKYIAYKRIHEEQELFVYLNFSGKELIVKTPKLNLELIFSTESSRKKLDIDDLNEYIKLAPLEGVIIKSFED